MNGMVADGVLDPALGWTLRLFLASVFARAVFGKLRLPSEFATALRGYELVPDRLAGIVAAALLATECVLVPALLVPSTATAAAMLGASVLFLYSLAIGINLGRGRRDIDCGCGGPQVRQTLHEMLIARNLVYVVIALAAAVPFGARVLTWLDGLTIGLGVVCLVALAVAIDGLAALASRTRPSGALR